MDRKTADLESYIGKVLQDSSLGWVFKRGFSHRRPQLESHRTNRILLYPGSFNPPHRGHAALLRHAFENCQDINVIAAIILPRDDNSVKEKCHAQRDSVIFTQAQRAELWTRNTPHDWCWVYGGSMDAWVLFHDQLISDVMQDGFDIRFAVLGGPDQFRLCEPSWTSVRYSELIVSNVGRPADFVQPGDNNSLFNLSGYGPWEYIPRKDAQERQFIINKTKFLLREIRRLDPPGFRQMLEQDPSLFETVAEKLYAEYDSALRKIRVCHRTASPEYSVRFIPAKEAAQIISSTEIRRLITTYPANELRERLESVVLSPDLVLDYIRTRRNGAGGPLSLSSIAGLSI